MHWRKNGPQEWNLTPRRGAKTQRKRARNHIRACKEEGCDREACYGYSQVKASRCDVHVSADMMNKHIMLPIEIWRRVMDKMKWWDTGHTYVLGMTCRELFRHAERYRWCCSKESFDRYQAEGKLSLDDWMLKHFSREGTV